MQLDLLDLETKNRDLDECLSGIIKARQRSDVYGSGVSGPAGA